MSDDVTLDMFRWVVVLKQAAPGQQRIISLHTSNERAEMVVGIVCSRGIEATAIERGLIEGPLVAELDQVLAAMRSSVQIRSMSAEQLMRQDLVAGGYEAIFAREQPDPGEMLESFGRAMAGMAETSVPPNLRGPRPTAMHLFTHAVAMRGGEIGLSDDEVENLAREACRHAAIFDRVVSECFDPPSISNPFAGPSGPDERNRLPRKG